MCWSDHGSAAARRLLIRWRSTRAVRGGAHPQQNLLSPHRGLANRLREGTLYNLHPPSVALPSQHHRSSPRTHNPLDRLAGRSPSSAAAAMVLEATMICVDNSEWMRNGDYCPSRFAQQSDAVAIICNAKLQANRESSVGVLAMAGRGVSVIVTPTSDIGKVLARMHGLQIGGEANLTVAIQVAQLALENRQNKQQQQQRIIVFVGSPVIDDRDVLEAIGKKLKKNNVALDVVDFGESEGEKPEKLEALVAAVSSGGNSHIIHVLPGEDFLSNVILCSPILAEDQESVIAAAGFEFGVDPNVDPELALAFQVFIEEERARQEDAAEESSETKSTCQSLTLNDDIVMADAESEPNQYTEDKRNLQTGEEDQLLQQAYAMLIEDGNHGTLRLLGADEVELVLQTSVQEEETGSLSDMSEVFGDQPFVQSVTYALPGIDLNDISNKDLREWHDLLIGPSEAKKQRKKHKKKQHKKREDEEKKDEPAGDKSQ
ncbi:hypothetical protein PVAP13_9NG350500 [Panicum virgatum]|uniref:26S proteasome non-ATPase regulatory subunit 4 homolog n=2 Tax=Panicum virgatum TaxID=38727 RepID=A0A8T0MPX8_PANVG|nr:hypothetical protein PVAP13_9NG350500 [Panicum virgatum]